MKKHSSSNAQDDAIVYMHNGKPVLATVLKKFQASSVRSSKGFTSVSGSSKLYAQAIDIETGKVLWSHRLKAENNRGQDWGDAILLGQSSRYLFFLRNELYVISKETGEIVARNENLKDLQDKLLTESSIYPTFINNYAYNDSLQAVVIKGSDGLTYLLDGNTLQTKQEDNPYFEKSTHKPHHIDYNTQLVTITREGELYSALMSDKDQQLLQQGNKIPYGPREAARRFLFTGKQLTLQKANNDLYLYGGFLKAANQDTLLFSQNDPLYYKGIYQLLSRGDEKHQTAFQLPGGGHIILHRTTVERDAPILLTAVKQDGKKLWQIATNMRNIVKVIELPDHLVVMASQENNNSFSDLLYISLSDGSTRKYNFKDGTFSPLIGK
ncbi:hypothetical protein GO493_29820 [Chitinophaga sp. ysch24]|uniref:Uncharacterized protein n=2 Tax=Chitinophaga tropicalis TaxID=2683588 RepID=A0A7K1UDM0_9BACT|nr:hypothetical protein [Chitinophaga tropicalis]